MGGRCVAIVNAAANGPLEDLVGRGIVATDGDPVIGGTYRLAAT